MKKLKSYLKNYMQFILKISRSCSYLEIFFQKYVITLKKAKNLLRKSSLLQEERIQNLLIFKSKDLVQMLIQRSLLYQEIIIHWDFAKIVPSKLLNY